MENGGGAVGGEGAGAGAADAGESERLGALVASIDAKRLERAYKQVIHQRVPEIYRGYYDRHHAKDSPAFPATHVTLGTYVSAKPGSWWRALQAPNDMPRWREVVNFEETVEREYEAEQYVTDLVGLCVRVSVAFTAEMHEHARSTFRD
jgi:hypothetical protein